MAAKPFSLAAISAARLLEATGTSCTSLKLVDNQLRHKDDQPSVGIILCKSKNRLIAEYALRDTHKPIGVAAYTLTKALPEKLKGTLPTIKDLESELGSHQR